MSRFDWDEINSAHIARHGVTREEAEECCSLDSVAIDVYPVDEEVRYEEIGQTRAGRILTVVTTERDGKMRVVTAYDATPYRKRLYLSSKGKS